MAVSPNVRRLTLRQLLTNAEKAAHDLAAQLTSTLLSRIADARELTRPVRRRSHYPTLMAVSNSLRKLDEADAEIEALVDFLLEHMEAIRDAAKRERQRR